MRMPSSLLFLFSGNSGQVQPISPNLVGGIFLAFLYRISCDSELSLSLSFFFFHLPKLFFELILISLNFSITHFGDLLSIIVWFTPTLCHLNDLIMHLIHSSELLNDVLIWRLQPITFFFKFLIIFFQRFIVIRDLIHSLPATLFNHLKFMHFLISFLKLLFYRLTGEIFSLNENITSSMQSDSWLS